jgi:branched-chain amino acid transport system permease protein
MIFNRSPWTLHGVLLAVAIVFPFISNSAFVINFGVLALFYAFIGQSWNIAGGFAGQLSFGHAAFFGVVPDASTIVQMRFGFNPWWGLPVSALAGAAAGWLIGVMSFRAGLKRLLLCFDHFGLCRSVSHSLPTRLKSRVAVSACRFGETGTAANFQFGDRRYFYFIILALTVVSVAIALWLKASPFWRSLGSHS